MLYRIEIFTDQPPFDNSDGKATDKELAATLAAFAERLQAGDVNLGATGDYLYSGELRIGWASYWDIGTINTSDVQRAAIAAAEGEGVTK